MLNVKFGRLIEFDEQSRQYPIRALIAKGTIPRSYTWSCAITLDQKDTPRCVGYSWAHEAAARPCVVPNVTNATGNALYKLAQENDEYPGEDYDGSSVLGGAKAAKIMKYLTEYRWSFSEMDLALAIGYKGPAVCGTVWTAGMMEPDAKGFIHPTGAELGGHAYLVNAISLPRDAYQIHNSWYENGVPWGKNGNVWIKRADLWKLLKNEGEACIPVIRRLP